MADRDDGNFAKPQQPSSRTTKINFRLEIVTDVQQLFSLKPHWDNLCHRSIDYNFSQSFQWCLASWNIMILPRQRRLYCLVGWLDNRMVLMWPFVKVRHGLWSMLRPLASDTTVYSDVLVENNPKSDLWVALAWQKLRITCNSDIISLPFVRIGSRLYRLLSQERPLSAWVNSTSGVNWDENQEWESYYRSLKRDFRYSLRSRRHRLTERGKLSFEAVTNHEQFPPILDWLFTHKTEWINRTRQRNPWQDVELYKKFLITVSAEGDDFGNIMLFVLKVDAQIIGAVLARISKFTVEAFIAAFDRAYRQYGPGQLLCEDILKWALERRLEFDFRMGDEVYKRKWTNQESKVITYRFINSTWGAVFSLASRCRWKLQSLRRQLLP
jgi:CelD/BcsL family acetyltransferase involved in cellulose biosynthesis